MQPLFVLLPLNAIPRVQKQKLFVQAKVNGKMSRKALKLVKFEEASNSKLNGDGTAQPKFRNRLRWNPWLQSKVNLKTTTVLNEAAAQTDCKGIIERRLNDELSN